MFNSVMIDKDDEHNWLGGKAKQCILLRIARLRGL